MRSLGWPQDPQTNGGGRRGPLPPAAATAMYVLRGTNVPTSNVRVCHVYVVETAVCSFPLDTDLLGRHPSEIWRRPHARTEALQPGRI